MFVSYKNETQYRTELTSDHHPFPQDYLDLPVIGGDSASENESDDKSESG